MADNTRRNLVTKLRMDAKEVIILPGGVATTSTEERIALKTKYKRELS